MWTHFWDMHSGGGQKLDWPHIFIEAPEEEAKIIFFNRFGRSPERVTCTCCGEDYSISSGEDIAQLTAYHRGCKWVRVKGEKGDGHYVEEPDPDYRGKNFQTLVDYGNSKEVHIIKDTDIKPHERLGTLPEEGYVWAGG